MHRQAQDNIDTANRILALYTEMRKRFRDVLNSQHFDRALDFIFANPVFYNDRFIERSGIPAASARVLSRRLLEAGQALDLGQIGDGAQGFGVAWSEQLAPQFNGLRLQQ